MEKRRKGRRLAPSETLLADFSEALEQAMVTAEVGHVATIARAAQGTPAVAAVYDEKGRLLVPHQRAIPPDWRASMEHLERTAPHRWGRRIFRIEETGPASATSTTGSIRTYTVRLPELDPLPPRPVDDAPQNGVAHRDHKPDNVRHDDEDQDDHDGR